MKISIIPKKYGEQLSCDGLDGVPKDYRDSLLNELKGDDVTFEIKEANYGTGEDWIWMLISLYGTYKLIIEGDKIDKGLNGWNNILKKIKKLLKRSRFVKLDGDVLLLIAVNEVFKRSKGINELIFIKKSEIDIQNNNGFFINKPISEFTSKDDAYSIFILQSDMGELFIVGVRITGEVDILKKILVKKFE